MTTTICPKCRHARPDNATVPAWQCPACGVAYAKAGAAPLPGTAPAVRSAGHRANPGRAGLPWRAITLVLAIAVGIYSGHLAHLDKGLLPGPAAGMDEAAIRTLAGSVRAEQVVMYSTTECGYCTQARAWLGGHGFAFTECNMSLDARCTDEFQALKGEGTPYLIVRGPRGEHHMKEGFDSDEFLSALSG